MITWKRREFLKAGIVLPFALGSAGCSVSEVTQTPYPFVDGLSLQVEQDLDRLLLAGLSGVVLDVSVAVSVDDEKGGGRWKRSFEQTLDRIASVTEAVENYESCKIVKDGSSFSTAHFSQQTGIVLQVQGGGELIEGDIERLSHLRDIGVRVFQMTHHHNNQLGGGVMEPETSGLTPLGRSAVEMMNDLGLIPDVSHASDQTAIDTIESSSQPVILSHGAARALVNNARCAPDEVLRKIGDSGGVIGVFMMSFWLTEDPVPTPESYLKQLRHVANVAGIEAVGIANDFPLDGDRWLNQTKGDNSKAVQGYKAWWNGMNELGIFGFENEPVHVAIPEFNKLERMYNIHTTLEASDFTPREVEMIMGGNWIRLYNEA